MKRIDLYITKQQALALKALFTETGMSISEHIRRAIDDYLEKMRSKVQNVG